MRDGLPDRSGMMGEERIHLQGARASGPPRHGIPPLPQGGDAGGALIPERVLFRNSTATGAPPEPVKPVPPPPSHGEGGVGPGAFARNGDDCP